MSLPISVSPCAMMILYVVLCISTIVISPVESDVGSPVYLTPLLEEGKNLEAQRVSRVTPDIGNITSYSGFFTVNKACDSHLFFWFMPAQDGDWQKAPLLYWQQGGPGTSSFLGLFEELGPFKHFKNASRLRKRQYFWNIKNNLLMIDNPAGVGYSYTGKDCYPDNEVTVAESWYKALVQFYKLFAELRNNPLILSGESYAGHYIPSYAHTIHKNNPTAEVKVNLTGMMILSSWSDPITQFQYGDLYYQLGLIDDQVRDAFYAYQKLCVEYISSKNWDYAVYFCNMINVDLYNKFIGPDVNIYNLLPDSDEEEQDWKDWVKSDEFRKACHVGNLTYSSINANVLNALIQDDCRSVKSYIQELLEHYHIVFVSGQLDILAPYSLLVKVLRSLQWSGNTTYLNATRKRWCYNNVTVGYFKGEDRLYEVMVRGAGHFVPLDKPALGFLLANSVTSGFPGHPLHALQECDPA